MADDHKTRVNAEALRVIANDIEAHLGTEATVEVYIRHEDYLRLLDKAAESYMEVMEQYYSLLANAKARGEEST